MENKAKQLFDGAIAELKSQLDLGRSDVLTRYLECMSRFHRYSWCNILLINQQFPAATHVAGYCRWKELDRSVCKGEKGIGIMAPLVRRKQADTCTMEKGEKFVAGFRVVHVFDVSQTEGRELPELSKPTGDADWSLAQLEAAVEEAGLKLTYEPLGGSVHGYSADGAIGVDASLSAVERFLTLVHELAHQWLGHLQSQDLSNRVRETEAEASAFVVARACGIDAVASSSEYIQLYSGDSALLGASLGRIQVVANRIVDAMHRPRTESNSRELTAVAA